MSADTDPEVRRLVWQWAIPTREARRLVARERGAGGAAV